MSRKPCRNAMETDHSSVGLIISLGEEMETGGLQEEEAGDRMMRRHRQVNVKRAMEEEEKREKVS